MFYLTTHLTHFIDCYMASDIWTTQLAREKIRCRHMGYSFRLEANAIFLCIIPQTGCYTSRRTLAVATHSSIGPP